MWLCMEMEARMPQGEAGGPRPPEFSSFPVKLVSPWNYYKFILRACCLVLSILATLMILSTVDGRMAHVQGSYTGYLGIWPNCGRHRCANLDQVTGQ